MPIVPDLPFPKVRGHVIRSKDWNDIVAEVQRLDTAKVNRVGDTMTGPLSVTAALTAASATVAGALSVGGNLGAGPGTPAARAHVFEPAAAAVLRIQSGLAFGAANVEFWSDPRSSVNEWRPATIRSVDNGGFTGGLAFITNGTGAAQRTTQFEAMRVVNGRVGIGTTTPNAALSFGTVLGDKLYLWDGAGDKYGFGVAGGQLRIFCGPGSDILFGDNTGAVFSERVRISQTGNVGIGFTTDVAQKLRVNGDVRVEGNLTVLGTGTFVGNISAPNKAGFVSDYFLNHRGDKLEQGDVVVISKAQPKNFWAVGNAIPVAEVDLTDRANDSAVCGVVVRVVPEAELPFVEADPARKVKKGEEVHPFKGFAAKTADVSKQGVVEDRQLGQMVTLGAYSFCKVDADIAPIQVGDLLTTSPTRGHAQKVTDPAKAAGSILGKALGALKKGKGKIAILVTLH